MVAVASGDAIPLLDDNGSGQYIKGRNNALDIRAGLLGALFATLGAMDAPRPGVLNRWDQTGDLRVLQNGGGGQNVLIGKGRAIVPRSGQGAYLFENRADQIVAMPAASGVNPRIDIVCATMYDKGPFPADASHGPEFTVVQGTPAGSPAVPGTPTDSIKLGEVFRAVNDNVITTGEITDKRAGTTLNGAIRRIGAGDSLADAGQLTGEMRDTGTSLDRWTGSVWETIVSYAGAATGLHAAYYAAAAQSIPNLADTKVKFDTTETSDASVTVAGTGNVNFTPNKAGVWRVSVSGRTDIATPPTWLIFLALSSSSVSANRLAVGSCTGQFPAFAFSYEGRLSAGTAYSVYAYHEAAGAKLLAPEGKSLRISWTWVRP